MQAVTALELANALTVYERHVRQLAGTWLDMELYRMVSDEIDRIRTVCAACPALSVPWVNLLVSHADLVHCLWRSTQPGQRLAPGELEQRLEDHLRCGTALAQHAAHLAGHR